VRKKWFLLGVTLLLASLLAVGCGVPQEDYDAVVAERDAAQAEATSLQSELAGVQGELDDTKRDLSTTESNLATAESDLATAQNEIKSAQTSASEARSQLNSMKADMTSSFTSLREKLSVQEAILNYWNYTAKSTYGETSMEEFLTYAALFLVNTGTKIDAVGNAELSQLWENFITYAALDEVEMMISLTTLTDLINDLINQDTEAIDAKL
jgi:Skp family chaperone for outer membrane proteins